MNKFPDVFIFTSYFSQSFFTLNRGYESVKNYTKSRDIFECRLVIFPLISHSHWFLAVYEVAENNLYILDPYTKDQPAQHTINEHMERLQKIERLYLMKHFETQKQEDWKDVLKGVKMPPIIPEQLDGHNCGVFLLEFTR